MADATEEFDIVNLIPHRRTMSLLSRVVKIDASSAVVEAVVSESNPFIRDQVLHAWIGIEYMAQAVAVWAGRQAQLEGRGLDLGFLLGTRRYEAYCQHFKVGSVLTIEACCEFRGENGLGNFACRILENNQLTAAANINVFEPPDGVGYLGVSRD